MNILKTYIILLVGWCLASCSDMHDPMLHIAAKVDVIPTVEQNIQLDMMWQADWQTRWQINWDTSAKGELGYTIPSTFHLNYYRASGNTFLGQRDMATASTRINLPDGKYNLFTYSNDYDYVRVTTSDNYQQITAHTINDAYYSIPDSMEKKLTMQHMPDPIFSMFATDVTISDRLEDYTYIPEEDVYVLKLNTQLEPRVYIYLIQLELKNNTGKVVGCNLATITELASSTNLATGETGNDAVAHQFSTIFQEFGVDNINKESKNSRATKTAPNEALIGGRLTTFGRPKNSKKPNICYFSFQFANGMTGFYPIDITNQMKELPKGGVINLSLDMTAVEPPKGSGGWGIGIGNWNDTNIEIDISK